MNIIDLEEEKKKRQPELTFQERLDKIKQSLARINKLMEDLKDMSKGTKWTRDNVRKTTGICMISMVIAYLLVKSLSNIGYI